MHIFDIQTCRIFPYMSIKYRRINFFVIYTFIFHLIHFLVKKTSENNETVRLWTKSMTFPIYLFDENQWLLFYEKLAEVPDVARESSILIYVCMITLVPKSLISGSGNDRSRSKRCGKRTGTDRKTAEHESSIPDRMSTDFFRWT